MYGDERSGHEKISVMPSKLLPAFGSQYIMLVLTLHLC